MFGLIYRAFTYFLNPSPLNKGERDQPAPLDVQEDHLVRELARVRREREVLAERRRAAESLERGEGRDEGGDGGVPPEADLEAEAPQQEA